MTLMRVACVASTLTMVALHRPPGGRSASQKGRSN
jgi:hypothetical protein